MPEMPKSEDSEMIHEMNMADRLRASIANPPARERMTCEREAVESQAAQSVAAKSCHVCGDPEDYCVICEQCKKPVCDKHRTQDEFPVCFGCSV